jgi:hypothetical protein
MSMSNIEYSALKKKGGLHNWGFLGAKNEEFDFDMDELEEMELTVHDVFSPDLLHQNSFGEYYALQDFEE